MKKLTLLILHFTCGSVIPQISPLSIQQPQAADLADTQQSTNIVSSTYVTPQFTSISDIPVSALSPESQVSDTYLRKGCDKIYAENVASILTQFKALATAKELEEFKQFMLAVKLHSDLGFKLRAFEKNTILDILAVLRVPITKYSACRTRIGSNLGYSMLTPSPTKRELLPCETTYAKNVQVVLDTFRGQISPKKIKAYQDFMITLKYFEDLVFQIQSFEKRAKSIYEGRNITLHKLRLPLRNYDTCRDSIIRREQQQRTLAS